MLQAGDKAPSFRLASDGGRTVDSATLKGRRHVIYFYPKDDTPGCTREACAFRDNLPAFEALAVPVFGVSADETKAHDRFVQKYSLNFPLLSDPGHQLLEAYGVWVEKSLYGRKYFGIQRSTFVIDAKGKIERVWDKVSPDSHADEVRAYLAGDAPVAKKTAAKKTARPR
jgi:peroxiredoxin Q/BCP